MQFLRLNETCRMIDYSLYQMMSTLVTLGLSGYDVKPCFGAIQCEYLLQNELFFRKRFWWHYTPTRKKRTHPRSFRGGGCTVRPAGS